MTTTLVSVETVLGWWYEGEVRVRKQDPPLRPVTRTRGGLTSTYDGRGVTLLLDTVKGPKRARRGWATSLQEAVGLARKHVHLGAQAGFYKRGVATQDDVRTLFGWVLDFDDGAPDVDALLDTAATLGITVNLINLTDRGYQLWVACQPLQLVSAREAVTLHQAVHRALQQAYGADPHALGLTRLSRVPKRVVYWDLADKPLLREVAAQLGVSDAPAEVTTQQHTWTLASWLAQPCLQRFTRCPAGHRESAAFWLCRQAVALGADAAVLHAAFYRTFVTRSHLPVREWEHAVRCALKERYRRYAGVPRTRLSCVPGLADVQVPACYTRYVRVTTGPVAPKGGRDARLTTLQQHLADHAGEVVTQASLATLLGCSVSTVKTYLATLPALRRTARGCHVPLGYPAPAQPAAPSAAPVPTVPSTLNVPNVPATGSQLANLKALGVLHGSALRAVRARPRPPAWAGLAALHYYGPHSLEALYQHVRALPPTATKNVTLPVIQRGWVLWASTTVPLDFVEVPREAWEALHVWGDLDVSELGPCYDEFTGQWVAEERTTWAQAQELYAWDESRRRQRREHRALRRRARQQARAQRALREQELADWVASYADGGLTPVTRP